MKSANENTNLARQRLDNTRFYDSLRQAIVIVRGFMAFSRFRQLAKLMTVFVTFTLTGFSINTKAKLLQALEQIYKDDQRYRSFDDDIIINEDDLAYADMINLMKVEAIFKRYGWPNVLTIDDKAHIALFLVIQHTSLKKQLQYAPLIWKAAREGKLRKSQAAMLDDRMAVAHGKPQIYGSQIVCDAATNECYVHPIAEPETVDARRGEMGMEPLATYVARWEIKL